MLRLFAALAIPDEVAERLLLCQQGPRSAAWRPREALHLTLRFFGEVGGSAAEALDDALAAVRQSPFDLHLEGAGAFASEGGRGALYAAAADSEPLRRLASKCDAAARRAGLKPGPRTFRPHVTLAYTPGPPGAVAAEWVAATNLLRAGPWKVADFALYSSILAPEGSRYRLERIYALK